MNFPVLSVAHDITCRNNTVPVTTQDIKHSSWGGGEEGSTLQVKQEHSGVPALGVASWRHQQAYSLKKMTQTLQQHLLMSPHICSELTCSLCSLTGAWALVLKFFLQMYSGRQSGRKRLWWHLMNVPKCTAGVAQKKKAPPQKRRKGAHFPPVRIFSARGWHHLQSLTDVHRTVSWHTGLPC